MAPSASGSGPVLRHVSDRRRAPRARLGVAVTLTVGGKLVDAMGGDVSSGGMRILAGVEAKRGEQVSLVFFLNGDIVSAHGTVQWCVPARHGLFTFGVRFTTLEDDGPALVDGFCRTAVS